MKQLGRWDHQASNRAEKVCTARGDIQVPTTSTPYRVNCSPGRPASVRIVLPLAVSFGKTDSTRAGGGTGAIQQGPATSPMMSRRAPSVGRSFPRDHLRLSASCLPPDTTHLYFRLCASAPANRLERPPRVELDCSHTHNTVTIVMVVVE